MRRLRRTSIVFMAAALLLATGAAAAQASKVKPPFFPITHERLAVPAGVQPWLPNWTPDGSHIVFQNQLDGTTWVTG